MYLLSCGRAQLWRLLLLRPTYGWTVRRLPAGHRRPTSLEQAQQVLKDAPVAARKIDDSSRAHLRAVRSAFGHRDTHNGSQREIVH